MSDTVWLFSCSLYLKHDTTQVTIRMIHTTQMPVYFCCLFFIQQYNHTVGEECNAYVRQANSSCIQEPGEVSRSLNKLHIRSRDAFSFETRELAKIAFR